MKTGIFIYTKTTKQTYLIIKRLKFFDLNQEKDPEFHAKVKEMWLQDRLHHVGETANSSTFTLQGLDKRIKGVVCDINSTETRLLDHTLPRNDFVTLIL